VLKRSGRIDEAVLDELALAFTEWAAGTGIVSPGATRGQEGRP